MWLQGSFLHEVVISSRQMMQVESPARISSKVALGYSVFMVWMARRDMMTSYRDFLKDLQKGRYNHTIFIRANEYTGRLT